MITCQFCNRTDLTLTEGWEIEVHDSPYSVPEFSKRCSGSRAEPLEQSRTLVSSFVSRVESVKKGIINSVDTKDDKYLPELEDILSVLKNK